MPRYNISACHTTAVYAVHIEFDFRKQGVCSPMNEPFMKHLRSESWTYDRCLLKYGLLGQNSANVIQYISIIQYKIIFVLMQILSEC